MTEKRTTYLLPITIGPESDEGDLLHGLDDAYNNGLIPSDTTWHTPRPTDLPQGWRWAERDGTTAYAVHPARGAAFVTDSGMLQLDGSAPIDVISALLARHWGAGQ